MGDISPNELDPYACRGISQHQSKGDVAMNTNVHVAFLQPLDYNEMEDVNGGDLLSAILAGLIVNFIVNIDSAIRGFMDGWAAYGR